mgnify:CR=1 FL=1
MTDEGPDGDLQVNGMAGDVGVADDPERGQATVEGLEVGEKQVFLMESDAPLLYRMSLYKPPLLTGNEGSLYSRKSRILEVS